MWITPRRVANLRLIATTYFLILAAVNFIATIANGIFRWTDTLFFMLSVAAFLLRRTTVLLWFCIGNMLLWGLLTLAITDDLIDYCAGIDQYRKPLEYFGIGYALMLTGAAMSFLMLFSYFWKKEYLDKTTHSR